MTSDSIIKNFEEIRRKSIKLWSGLPPEYYHWRPDTKAMTCIEMIRHVLETEHIYHVIIKNRGGHGDKDTVWAGRPYTTIQNELDFAEPFRKDFAATILSFSENDLAAINIVRQGRITRSLRDFLLRCNYHESVHAGQFLSYLRTLGLVRPNIWD